jgi:hypothetical protein
MTTKARPDAARVRESLHALSNSVAAARVWLRVLSNTSPAERNQRMPELLAPIDRSLGSAEESCHTLRQLLHRSGPDAPEGNGVSAAGSMGAKRRARRRAPR